MLTFSNFYLLNESQQEEMSFIHHFFEGELDKTSALVYADWLQEHDQEELAVAVRNAVNGIKNPDRQLLHDKYMSIHMRYPITWLNPRLSSGTWTPITRYEFILDGFSGNYVKFGQTVYMIDSHTHKYYKFKNNTLADLIIDDIGKEEFDPIQVNEIPDHILQSFFFCILHQWTI